MPSTSHKQSLFMKMCAFNRSASKKKCPPKKVAKEYVRADKKTRRY